MLYAREQYAHVFRLWNCPSGIFLSADASQWSHSSIFRNINKRWKKETLHENRQTITSDHVIVNEWVKNSSLPCSFVNTFCKYRNSQNIFYSLEQKNLVLHSSYPTSRVKKTQIQIVKTAVNFYIKQICFHANHIDKYCFFAQTVVPGEYRKKLNEW